MAESKPSRVLDNATRLIDALAEHGALGPGELADLMDIPRPTVYRLIEGLSVVDLVRPLADGRTDLSLRWLRLADATRRVSVAEETQQALALLAERTHQTTFLTVPRGHKAVCIDWAQGREIEILVLKPGRDLPLFAGAAGRVMLAALDDDDREQYLTQAPFPAFTPSTLTTAESLRADARRTLAEGYCHSDEDVTPNIGALGVPVPDEQARLIACLSLAGSAAEISGRRGELIDALRQTLPQITLN